jgi:hypothetical protein
MGVKLRLAQKDHRALVAHIFRATVWKRSQWRCVAGDAARCIIA